MRLVGDLLDALLARHLEAGVVDQDVEAAELLDGVGHHPVARLAVAQVRLDRDVRTPGLLEQRGRLVGVGLLLGQVGERDIGALAGIRDRDGAADAGVTAGDQCLASLEPAAALVGLLAVIRHRLHVARQPGRLLLLRWKCLGFVVAAHAGDVPTAAGR